MFHCLGVGELRRSGASEPSGSVQGGGLTSVHVLNSYMNGEGLERESAAHFGNPIDEPPAAAKIPAR